MYLETNCWWLIFSPVVVGTWRKLDSWLLGTKQKWKNCESVAHRCRTKFNDDTENMSNLPKIWNSYLRLKVSISSFIYNFKRKVKATHFYLIVGNSPIRNKGYSDQDSIVSDISSAVCSSMITKHDEMQEYVNQVCSNRHFHIERGFILFWI